MDSSTLDRFVGTYLIGSCRILSITRDGEQLNAQMSGQPKLPIYPETPSKFQWRTINAQVTFAIENGRPATSATIHEGGGEVVATRLDETETRAIEAKLARRIREQLPLPGSEAAVQKFFPDMKSGTPDYGDMDHRSHAALGVNVHASRCPASVDFVNALQCFNAWCPPGCPSAAPNAGRCRARS